MKKLKKTNILTYKNNKISYREKMQKNRKISKKLTKNRKKYEQNEKNNKKKN